MKPVKTVMLVKTKAADNNNKFYEVNLYDDGNVVGRNGRVGTDGVLQKKGPIGEAGYDKLVKEKMKGGYKPVEIATIEVMPSGSTKVRESLEDIAFRDIANHNPVLTKLIKRLCDINRFQLLQATGGQITIVDGVVKTPVGPVTLNAVNSGKAKLASLQQFVNSQNFGSEYVEMLEDYLTCIPQKIPHKGGWAETFFTNFTDFQRQSDLLEQLENSIKNFTAPAASDEEETEAETLQRMFGYSLIPVDGGPVFDKINRFYTSGINRIHVASNRKLVRVYQMTNEDKAARYKAIADRLGNTKMLWHGTRAHNVLSILKGGLIIPPASGAGGYTIAGRMFGNGVYFSDQSTKSLNYSAGYWSGDRDNGNIFMLNAEVAMGREYIPRGPMQNRPSGYDSIYAIGGKSGVMNNEMIVDNVDQFRLDHLCEFE
jgi:poly [ADP-ribose] polymerase